MPHAPRGLCGGTGRRKEHWPGGVGNGWEAGLSSSSLKNKVRSKRNVQTPSGEPSGFALCGWQPLFCPRLLFLALKVAYTYSPWFPTQSGGQAKLPSCSTAPCPSATCARAGHTAAEPGARSAPAPEAPDSKPIAVPACPWAGSRQPRPIRARVGATRAVSVAAPHSISVAAHRVGGEQ